MTPAVQRCGAKLARRTTLYFIPRALCYTPTIYPLAIAHDGFVSLASNDGDDD